jgi:hypothetical protein
MIDRGVPRHVMAATTNRDVEAERARQPHRLDDIGEPGTAGYQSGVFVDKAVVDPAEIVVTLIGRAQQPSRKRLRGLIDGTVKY